jgi:DNA-binding response OmpR family regulator
MKMSSESTTILVVDDDPDIASLMRDFLAADGYEVVVANSGESALVVLGQQDIDCVLLDVMMPGLTGFDVVRKIREESETPILFLSARHEASDQIRGLGLGADDYIVKSATPAEVVARVKAVLRRAARTAQRPNREIDMGRIVIDVAAREVRRDNRPVPLTAREFDLVQFFAEHPRQVFSRDQLFDRFWGAYGDRHTVTVHIGRLREKLEDDPTNPELFVTVWGVGYRFEGHSQP